MSVERDRARHSNHANSADCDDVTGAVDGHGVRGLALRSISIGVYSGMVYASGSLAHINMTYTIHIYIMMFLFSLLIAYTHNPSSVKPKCVYTCRRKQNALIWDLA